MPQLRAERTPYKLDRHERARVEIAAKASRVRQSAAAPRYLCESLSCSRYTPSSQILRHRSRSRPRPRR